MLHDVHYLNYKKRNIFILYVTMINKLFYTRLWPKINQLTKELIKRSVFYFRACTSFFSEIV